MKTTMPKPGSYLVIRVDGTEETVPQKPRMTSVYGKIGISCADTVNLRNGYVMVVDDTGMIDGKPMNPKATELYHSVCRQGTVHGIHGDVAVVWDDDFA